LGKGIARLATPVQRKRFLSGFMPAEGDRLAGQSALARYSLLASPEHPGLCSSWAYVEKPCPAGGGYRGGCAGTGDAEIQLWKYSPERFAEGRHCGPALPLFLSMRDDPDERVQGALETLLKEMSW
jgi:hypothetical protein